MSTIWIRADANNEIGTGHVMRCLSIATEIESLGHDVLFVVADDASAKVLQERGRSYLELHTDYKNLDDELQVLLPLLEEKRPKAMLVDSYFVTESYLKCLGEYITVAYMDDKVMFPYPVHTLINYNIYGVAELYHPASEEVQNFLLGPKYVPLRKEFLSSNYQVRESAENVLITTGGGDKYNIAGEILQKALEDTGSKQLHYHVICGVFNKHLKFLQEIAEKHENVHLYQNVKNMSELMNLCDIAISAAGSTLYELCAVGTPILCFSFVDNQEPMVKSFVEKNIVYYGGNYLEEPETMVDILLNKVVELKENLSARLEFSERERTLVDGKGALRIAEHICRLV